MSADPLAALVFFFTGAFCFFFFSRLLRLTQLVSFIVDTTAFVILYYEEVLDKLKRSGESEVEIEKKKKWIVELVFNHFPSYYHKIFKFKDWDSAIEWAEKRKKEL